MKWGKIRWVGLLTLCLPLFGIWGARAGVGHIQRPGTGSGHLERDPWVPAAPWVPPGTSLPQTSKPHLLFQVYLGSLLACKPLPQNQSPSHFITSSSPSVLFFHLKPLIVRPTFRFRTTPPLVLNLTSYVEALLSVSKLNSSSLFPSSKFILTSTVNSYPLEFPILNWKP